ncbi:MAG: proton-conducting membrane transporter, partial [Acetatifactor sp.]|nr:proton-conducting membrane transporter [Acetatifactor sp.]
MSGLRILPEKKVSGEQGSRLIPSLAIGVLLALAVLAMWVAWSGDKSVTLFYLTKNMPICFQVDDLSRWFVSVVTVLWVPVAVYSVAYMRHEGGEKRFFVLYLLVYGVLVCLDFAGNLVTMYLCYELVTLVSFQLVMHNGSREAIMAALKYLFYSLCGAYMGLFGIFFLYQYGGSCAFAAGGVLS